jgi:hypothetical protein
VLKQLNSYLKQLNDSLKPIQNLRHSINSLKKGSSKIVPVDASGDGVGVHRYRLQGLEPARGTAAAQAAFAPKALSRRSQMIAGWEHMS